LSKRLQEFVFRGGNTGAAATSVRDSRQGSGRAIRRILARVKLQRLDLAAEIYHIREPQEIPLVMSPDEARRLLAVADNLKVRTLLGLGYGCGLRGGQPEGQAYRQSAEHRSGRAVQWPQCHAVAGDVRPTAPMVEGARIA
jgi:site-specific recombinase XerC